MNQRGAMVRSLLFAALLFSCSLVAQPMRAAAVACIDDWSVAAPVVRAQGLVTVEALSKLVRMRLNANIVKAALCERDGRFFYRIVTRGRQGLKSLLLDARTPFDKAGSP
jgi:hypothetical protein